jgi:hypothetical protein
MCDPGIPSEEMSERQAAAAAATEVESVGTITVEVGRSLHSLAWATKRWMATNAAHVDALSPLYRKRLS